MKPELIFAIDPGTEKSAYVLFSVVDEIIKGCDFVDNSWVLHELKVLHGAGHFLKVVCEDFECFGMPIGVSSIKTIRWTGRFEQACCAMDLPFEYLKRSKIRGNICNSQNAKDSNIRQALIDRYGAPGTKKNPGRLYGVKSHIWSALAVAVTYQDLYLKE